MGAFLALTLALALHDPHGGTFSLEFSVAAVFPFGPRTLRGGSHAIASWLTKRRCLLFALNSCNSSDVGLRHIGKLRWPGDVGLLLNCSGLGSLPIVSA